MRARSKLLLFALTLFGVLGFLSFDSKAYAWTYSAEWVNQSRIRLTDFQVTAEDNLSDTAAENLTATNAAIDEQFVGGSNFIDLDISDVDRSYKKTSNGCGSDSGEIKFQEGEWKIVNLKINTADGCNEVFDGVDLTINIRNGSCPQVSGSCENVWFNFINENTIVRVDDPNGDKYLKSELPGEDCIYLTPQDGAERENQVRDLCDSDLTRGAYWALEKSGNDKFYRQVNVRIGDQAERSKPPLDAEDVEDQAADPKTCSSESGSEFGWLICPVINMMTELMNGLLTSGIMGNLMKLDLDQGDSDQATSLEQVWGGFRTVANLIFVISFFVIIYSAATGSVLSAYDVKKLVPRLFIVAILVQLSFFLSMLALDVSNIAGSGVRSLMLFPIQDDVTISVSDPFGNSEEGGDPTEWITDGAGAIGGAIVGVALLLLLLVLAFYSLAGILLLMGVFIVRDVGIVVLIVLSPLAFASAVLPGTESYLRTWWKWMFGLLAMFPIMIAFISAGQLVASIWTNADAFGAGIINTIIATFCLFLPFFLAPKVLKFAGAASGALTGVFKTLDDKRSQAKNSDMYKRTSQRVSGNAWNKASTSKLGRTGAGQAFLRSRTMGRRAGVAARGLEQLNQEDAQIAENFISSQVANMGDSQEQAFLRKSAASGSDGMKRAAMKRMLINKDVPGLEKVFENLEGSQEGQRLLDNFKKENAGDLNSTARHLLVGQKQVDDVGKTTQSRKLNGAIGLAGATPAQLATQHTSTIKSTMGTLTSAVTDTTGTVSAKDKAKAQAAINKMIKTIGTDIRGNDNLSGSTSEGTYNFIDDIQSIKSGTVSRGSAQAFIDHPDREHNKGLIGAGIDTINTEGLF